MKAIAHGVLFAVGWLLAAAAGVWFGQTTPPPLPTHEATATVEINGSVLPTDDVTVRLCLKNTDICMIWVPDWSQNQRSQPNGDH